MGGIFGLQRARTRGRSGGLLATERKVALALGRRFPESSWADVLKALELTEGQIRKKIR
jgi:hypothetical protein